MKGLKDEDEFAFYDTISEIETRLREKRYLA